MKQNIMPRGLIVRLVVYYGVIMNPVDEARRAADAKKLAKKLDS